MSAPLNHTQPPAPPRARREESGIALVVTVLLLLLVSAIGISAMNRAGDERVISTASRRQLANLAAAEAGMRIISEQLRSAGSGTGAPTVQINLPSVDLFKDPVSGLYTKVRSGQIGSSAIEPIRSIGGSQAGQEEGDELSAGKNSASGRRMVYRVNVTATDPSGGNTQVQAQFSVSVHAPSGY